MSRRDFGQPEFLCRALLPGDRGDGDSRVGELKRNMPTGPVSSPH